MTIAIITVCYNAAPTIASCLASVRSQSVPAEHIIVDGGSTDGTREILEAQRAGIARLVMEPDQGMYDALNKGIRLAAGDVIGILNADDFYSHGDVLAQVGRTLETTGADSCYGDLEYVATEPQRSGGRRQEAGGSNPGQIANRNSQIATAGGERVVRRWRAGGFRPDAFRWGWMPPHPTFFVRRSVYGRLGNFRLDLGTAADYELMLRFLLKHRTSTTYIPEVLVRMRVGGQSTVSLAARLYANEMDRKAWSVNGLRPYPWTIPFKPLRKLHQFCRDGLIWRMLLNRGG